MALLEVFDMADPNGCYLRKASTVPHQSLALMNSGLALDAARELAQITLSKALRKDADRWRWLRDSGPDNGYWIWEDQHDNSNGRLNHDWAEKIIDGAMTDD